MTEGVSVIMPVYNQAKFIRGAIASLFAQSYSYWELIIINDGSTDDVKEVLCDYLSHVKIKYFEFSGNKGLGVALNKGIQEATYNYIAYLPADDLFYSNHLESLATILSTNENAVLAFSGVRHNSSINAKSHKTNATMGKASGYSLQLAQVLHKKTKDRWLERNEFVTEDQFVMFWHKLSDKGLFVPSELISCEWVSHPKQRHKIIWDKLGGGLNTYRYYYKVEAPLNFRPSGYNRVDEQKQYASFRQKLPRKNDSLKILLVGELSYNPERIYAFEEKGHQLYGLWTNNPVYGMVGPIPFGNVKEVSKSNPVEDIKRIKPDIIYGLLNFMSVSIAHQILKSNLNIPFVWHFKEGPFYSRQYGEWDKLCDIFSQSDGQIYTSEVMRDWFSYFISQPRSHEMVLDGDLPKKDQFIKPFSTLLSEKDGEIHTVVPGRPLGIEPEDIAVLAKNKIHFHFYGDTFHTMWGDWIEKVKTVAGGFFHMHPNCPSEKWVEEFSQYDAGWLHTFESQNEGDIFRADWNDMNIPARLTTLALAGVPVIQKDNAGHVVETQSIVRKFDIGLFFKDYEDLAQQLNNKLRMRQLRLNMQESRLHFTFDYHVDDLINYFKVVINARGGGVML